MIQMTEHSEKWLFCRWKRSFFVLFLGKWDEKRRWGRGWPKCFIGDPKRARGGEVESEDERSEDERRIFQFKQSASLFSILINEIISCIFKAASCSFVDLVWLSSKNLSDSNIIRYLRSYKVCGFSSNLLSIAYFFNFLALLYWILKLLKISLKFFQYIPCSRGFKNNKTSPSLIFESVDLWKITSMVL